MRPILFASRLQLAISKEMNGRQIMVEIILRCSYKRRHSLVPLVDPCHLDVSTPTDAAWLRQRL